MECGRIVPLGQVGRVAHLSVDEFTSEFKAGAPSLRGLQGRGFCARQTVTDDLDIDPRRLDSAAMPCGLKRYHGTGHLHFITCSCYHRLPLLGKPGRRTLFLELLEQTRQRYDFVVVGYVVMPGTLPHSDRGAREGYSLDRPAGGQAALRQACAASPAPAETQGATNPVAGRREPVGSHLASPLL